MWPFRKKQPRIVRPHVPTLEEFLCLTIVQINAAQETYKDELRVIAKQYPLNGAVLELMTALTTIRRKAEETVFKIMRDDSEYARNLTSNAAVNAAFQEIINGLPEDMPRAFDGQKLVVGNLAQGIAETVYTVQQQ